MKPKRRFRFRLVRPAVRRSGRPYRPRWRRPGDTAGTWKSVRVPVEDLDDGVMDMDLQEGPMT